MRYYIAYGSNLNLENMKIRAPKAEFLGLATLKGYKLVFADYLTLIKDEERGLRVGVFKIDDDTEYALDRYEGYPILYDKEYVKIDLDGKEIEALVYIMQENKYQDFRYFLPSDFYAQTCLDGYIQVGIDIEQLVGALSETMKEIKKWQTGQ